MISFSLLIIKELAGGREYKHQQQKVLPKYLLNTLLFQRHNYTDILFPLPSITTKFFIAASPIVLNKLSMFLPYFALTKWTIAPKLVAYSIAVLKLTSSFSKRSVLLPTIAIMTLAGPQALSSSTQLCITRKECLEVISKTQMAILAVLQQRAEIDLYFSWPAVSQRWNLMDVPLGKVCTLVRQAAPSVVQWKGLNF